ncbi:MAG: hypothetical protein IPK61_08185 [Saprospiraceae bacterium]|nr:hypothetical protein [Saprospiraceae bacterium]
MQKYLFEFGMRKSDRMAAYLPNSPEATIGLFDFNEHGLYIEFCSPDFGAKQCS